MSRKNFRLDRSDPSMNSTIVTKSPAATLRSGRFVLCSRLGRSDVLGLESLGALHHVKLDCLAFLQAAKATCLDGRKMHENVVARLAADETEAFGVVKPFHCSLFHCVTCFYFEFLLRRIAAGDKGCRWLAGPTFNCGVNQT